MPKGANPVIVWSVVLSIIVLLAYWVFDQVDRFSGYLVTLSLPEPCRLVEPAPALVSDNDNGVAFYIDSESYTLVFDCNGRRYLVSGRISGENYLGYFDPRVSRVMPTD